jgi:prepilin-type N-terminal cleavage/methylation domain-containing protein
MSYSNCNWKKLLARQRFISIRSCSQGRLSKLRGMTLIELVVAIAIIGVLVSLLLVGVQAARESSRRASCQNNLRQIGLGLDAEVNSIGHYPSDGWGFGWVGDRSRGADEKQPGGWLFSLLPYIEQQSLFERFDGNSASTDRFDSVVGLYYCPSRRGAERYPNNIVTIPTYNFSRPPMAARNDYAICAGDNIVSVGAGPASMNDSDVAGYLWPNRSLATGISFVRMPIRRAEVTDGLSHTLAVAEKSLSFRNYRNGRSWGDDQCAFVGDDADIRRWTMVTPVGDRQPEDIESFGGPHAALVSLFCDGSIRNIGLSIDASVFRSMGNRSDGGVDRE